MMHGKTLIIALVMLVIGFAGGFVLRPVIPPAPRTVAIVSPATIVPASTGARGTQYFTAHLDEARQVVAACREGSVRGDECVIADAAVVKADAQTRFKRFMDN